MSENFAGITRAKGKEQGREALLDSIAEPADPSLRRRLESTKVWVWATPGCSVVRSVVVTDGPEPGRFRNVHVLAPEEGVWRCLVWQVTELRT